MVRERKRISDFATTSSGGTPSRGRLDYFQGNIRWVTTGELRDSYIKDTNEHISQEAVANSSAKVFPANTLLMAMYGATIGRLGIITNEAATNQACCAIFPDKTVDTKYLFYCLLYDRKNIVEKGCGAGQPNISQDIIKNIEVPYCDITEQQAIATALSDMDELITNLEKLIEKKKALKQGTMQALLTGKKRLPGFSGDIHYKSLSSLCEVFADGDWIESKNQSNDGIRLIQTGNVGVGRYLNKTDKQRFISEETFQKLNCLEIFENDVIVSRLPEPAGRACILPPSNKRRITAVDCTVIRFADYNPALFVAYTQTSEYQNKVRMTLAGSTRQRISRRELGNILVPVFPTKPEQDAIAEIIIDMDRNIDELNKKLQKYRLVKQGMMQKLLTGEIRLV